MIDLDTVARLVKAADDAAAQAAAIVQPAHAEALEAAERLCDELATAASSRHQRRELCEIVEAATAARWAKASATRLDAAALILQQFVGGLAPSDSITSADLRSGAFLFRSFRRFSRALPREQQVKVLDALLLAAQGKIERGLIDFPKDWANDLPDADADHMAALSDPDAHAQHMADRAELAAQYAKATRYRDALRQAVPTLYRTMVGDSSMVAVCNARGGRTRLSDGTTFAGDAVTELEAAHYWNLLANNPAFRGKLDSGTLEVVTTSTLAEAI